MDKETKIKKILEAHLEDNIEMNPFKVLAMFFSVVSETNPHLHPEEIKQAIEKIIKERTTDEEIQAVDHYMNDPHIKSFSVKLPQILREINVVLSTLAVIYDMEGGMKWTM